LAVYPEFPLYEIGVVTPGEQQVRLI
jgi:hypothetical protein